MIVRAGRGEARVREQADVEQRLLDAALPRHERDQRDRGERAGGEHGRRTSSPWTGASMTAQTKATRPTPESAAPVQSMRRATGSRDSGRSLAPATSAIAVSGTLTMKIEPHQKWSSRKPPTTGPSATPRPAVAAQMPIAIARSRVSVKTLISSESVAGMMNAAPAPMTARATIEPVDAARVGGPRRGDAEHREPARAACAGGRSDRRARRPAAAGPRTRACTRRPPTGARPRPRPGRAPAWGARR